MNKIKTKYNTLSKNQKFMFCGLSVIFAVILAPQIFELGEVAGSAFYHWVN